ncbi:MAG: hypothetical protein IT373_25200 [Polyangiaceae bacterium]|nr:hypothetical protein [Polyangiaceae bacterium]
MKLTMLPAGEGDALWLEWGPRDDRRKMLVDLGVDATGKALRARLEALPREQRCFDLLVVTHVDTDHINGVLSAFVHAEPLDGLAFGDVWFNGWTHLEGSTVAALDRRRLRDGAALVSDARTHVFGDDHEPYGGKQGEEFSVWLRRQPWNRAFGGAAVARPDGTLGRTVELAHGLRLTVLGPTTRRLAELMPKWKQEVAAALQKGQLDPNDVAPVLVPAGLEPMGRKRPSAPKVDSADKLETLAESSSQGDTSPPNGSSITLLLEYEKVRLLLAGDAFPADVVAALRLVDAPARPRFTAVKLPHHGSQNNVSRELVEAVECRHWLFSSNGAKHYHPDAQAVARVIRYASPTHPVLHFNEPSHFNGWWDRDDWRATHGYETRYGTATDGHTIALSRAGNVVKQVEIF